MLLSMNRDVEKLLDQIEMSRNEPILAFPYVFLSAAAKTDSTCNFQYVQGGRLITQAGMRDTLKLIPVAKNLADSAQHHYAKLFEARMKNNPGIPMPVRQKNVRIAAREENLYYRFLNEAVSAFNAALDTKPPEPRPATRDDLLGSWVSPLTKTTQTYTFSDDGTFVRVDSSDDDTDEHTGTYTITDGQVEISARRADEAWEEVLVVGDDMLVWRRHIDINRYQHGKWTRVGFRKR